MAKTLTMFACSSKVYSIACCKLHCRASDTYPSESVHMICFSEKCSLHVLWQKEKTKREGNMEERNSLCSLYMVLRILKMRCGVSKRLGCFFIRVCLQYTSHESFYRLCNFHFNILSSFEIIAKTLSVALDMLLSI